jgi:hypothetical protein
MLNAGGSPNTVVPVAPAVDPEAQRRAQETEAARLSRLFASTNIRELPAPTPAAAVSQDANAAPGQATQPSTDTASRRMAKTASSPSSTPPSIAAPPARTASRRRLRLSSFRRARSFQAR